MVLPAADRDTLIDTSYSCFFFSLSFESFVGAIRSGLFCVLLLLYTHMTTTYYVTAYRIYRRFFKLRMTLFNALVFIVVNIIIFLFFFCRYNFLLCLFLFHSFITRHSIGRLFIDHSDPVSNDHDITTSTTEAC